MSGNREQNFLAKFTDFLGSNLPMPLWLNSCQLGNPNNYKHILEAYKNGSLGSIVRIIAQKTTTAIPPVIDGTSPDDYSAGLFSPSDDRVKNPSKFTATLGEWLNDPGVDLIERIQLADEYSYISKGSGLWIQFKGEVNGKIDEPPKIATSQGIGRISVIANQDIKPLEHDNNETSDRYGLPTKYQITTYVDDGNGPQPKQTTVHWARLIIVSESNKNFGVFGDKVLAAPLLHPSRAIDLIAGSYGLGYFNHTQFKTITNVDDKSQQAFKQAIGDKDTKKQLDEEDKKFAEGEKSNVYKLGSKTEVINLTISDPNYQEQLKVISLQTGLSTRFWSGNQSGERASDMDTRNDNDFIMKRQISFINGVLRQLVERAVMAGAIEAPQGNYDFYWPDLNEKYTINEKVERLDKISKGLKGINDIEAVNVSETLANYGLGDVVMEDDVSGIGPTNPEQ